MNIIYRCLKCGWQITMAEGLDINTKLVLHINNNATANVCPRCNKRLLVDMYNETNTVANLIEEDEIEQMQIAIRSEGNDTIWKDIETIKSPYARAEERKVFIKSGGVVPRNFEIRT